MYTFYFLVPLLFVFWYVKTFFNAYFSFFFKSCSFHGEFFLLFLLFFILFYFFFNMLFSYFNWSFSFLRYKNLHLLLLLFWMEFFISILFFSYKKRRTNFIKNFLKNNHMWIWNLKDKVQVKTYIFEIFFL